MLTSNLNVIMYLAIVLMAPCTVQAVDSCYERTSYYISANTMDWFAAKSYCAEDGYELATIHSEEQNAYINKFVCPSEYCWLGLRDMDETQNWGWIDGSQLNYSNWHAIQPEGGEYYGAIWNPDTNGGWHDAPWSSPLHALCMKVNQPPTLVPTTLPTSKHPTFCQDDDDFFSFNLSLSEFLVISVFFILACACNIFIFIVCLRTNRSKVPQTIALRADHDAVIAMSNSSKKQKLYQSYPSAPPYTEGEQHPF